MRALALLSAAALSLTVLFACDDATKPPFLPEASPTVTAEATPTASTPTAVPESGSMAGFRAFAAEVVQAVEAGDGGLFVDRARQTTGQCAGREELGPCAGKPAGTELEGLWHGLWRTGAVELAAPDDIASDFESFVTNPEAGESDGFGAGSAVLYALASSAQGIFGEGDAFYAVVTAIMSGDGGTGRRIRVYQFTFDGERWRLYGVIEAGALYEEWLSAGCGDCYEQWELAQGIAR